ncbi:MAG: hypothetical protein ABH873_06385 [Candidatus Firestonebacteria bacterium]
MDYKNDWIWNLDKTPYSIPPFCLEIVLQDRSRYFVQCLIQKDEETKSMVFSIWDLRDFSNNDIETLRKNLNNIDISENSSYEKMHPKLDRANLRVHLDDICYCIEWHIKFWKIETREIKGFAGNKI